MICGELVLYFITEINSAPSYFFNIIKSPFYAPLKKFNPLIISLKSRMLSDSRIFDNSTKRLI